MATTPLAKPSVLTVPSTVDENSGNVQPIEAIAYPTP